MKVSDVVALCALFKELDPQAREKVASVGIVRELGPDSLLFEENDQGTGFYIVMDGFVRICKLAPDSRGTDRTLVILAAGDFFGEMALLDGELRSARAVTLTATRLVEFDRGEFNEFLDQDPVLANKVLRGLSQVMSRRIRATNDMVAGLLQKALVAEHKIETMRHSLTEDITSGLRAWLTRLEEEAHQLDSVQTLNQEAQTKTLEAFHHHIETYSHQVQEMLTLVDLCYGEYHPQVIALNVRHMVESVLSGHRADAERRKVRLVNKVSPLLGFAIDGRLRLALSELVDVLVQRSLSEQCIEITADASSLGLKVFPEGLEEGVLDALFTEMMELDENKGRVGKLGIGFALAKELIEAQGGRIEIRQQADATTIHLLLGAVHKGN